MSKKILFIKNISREGPGLIGALLHEYGIAYDTVDLARGGKIPGPGEYGAVVVLGGPDSANDKALKMREQIERVKGFLQQEIPYMGICLGLQILVKAAGGEVTKSEVKEVGFRDADDDLYQVEVTAEGEKDPLFEGLQSPFIVFQLHGETVKPAADMTLLAKGKTCLHQVLRAGKHAYGIQCHFELTESMLDTWLSEDGELRRLNKQKVLSDYAFLEDQYRATGRRLFTNFLKTAGFELAGRTQ